MALISIHALREEGDGGHTRIYPIRNNFYPRPPRGGRPASKRAAVSRYLISIHALREEGDRPTCLPRSCPFYFYPRPPRGGRPLVLLLACSPCKFLSTPSARRATYRAGKLLSHSRFLSTPSARRATSAGLPAGMLPFYFYPRPPRGGRHVKDAKKHADSLFLSTPSARRATAKTETKSLFSNKLYNILHEFRRALIYNGSKNYPNHAKRLENPVRRCRKNAENSPFAPGRETQNNSRPSCSKGG